MEAKVYSTAGEEVGTIELNDKVFSDKIRNGTIYDAIKCENINKRTGSASTKTRSEIRASGSKPWRQKGTGRARAGTRRSPLWKGGGITFGPKPKKYRYNMPKKAKRAAIRSILSLKNKNDRLRVVEDFTIEDGKTKNLLKILKNLNKSESTVLVITDEQKGTKRAGNNIPWLKYLSYNRLNAHDLFYGKNILLLESAAKELGTMYDRER